MTPSAPHNITIGTGDDRISPSAVFRLCGQASIGPIEVFDQSFLAISRPASPQRSVRVRSNETPSTKCHAPLAPLHNHGHAKRKPTSQPRMRATVNWIKQLQRVCVPLVSEKHG